MESRSELGKIRHKNWFLNFLIKITNKIKSLFEPEEVEVTFKVEGKRTSYTYTKVEHKQVA